MKLDGYRRDGALRVQIPGGLTIVLKDDCASRPLDDQEADRLGPWMDPEVSLTWEERQQLGKRLDRSHVVPLQVLVLKSVPVDAEEAFPYLWAQRWAQRRRRPLRRAICWRRLRPR